MEGLLPHFNLPHYRIVSLLGAGGMDSIATIYVGLA